MIAPLVSFDGTEYCSTRLKAPDRRREMQRILGLPGPIAMRGSGLSYPNAGAIEGGTTVSARAFDHLLDFDPEAGLVKAEAGLTVGALLRFVVGHGFWFAVLPGHPNISLGGLVACNTHGKTQHDIGNISDHIAALTLVHPDHGVVECGPERNSDVFELTIGGLGLTGWIADVTFRLKPLGGQSIRRQVHRVRNYAEAVATMRSLDRPGASIYSWNDANARGQAFGRGLVFEETFVDDRGGGSRSTRFRTLEADRRGSSVPFPLWGKLTVSAANRAYYAMNSFRSDRTLPVLDAAFPMNGKEGYFRMFGRTGFREYQVIIPDDCFSDAVSRIRMAIAHTGACVTLSSLKLFSGPRCLLWFRGDGICLTIDGPATPTTTRLFEELDCLAVEYSAPVNLAKDSRLSAETVAAVYPEHGQFSARLREFDPSRRFSTDLSRRIGV